MSLGVSHQWGGGESRHRFNVLLSFLSPPGLQHYFIVTGGGARCAGLPPAIALSPTSVGYEFRSLPPSLKLRRDRTLAAKQFSSVLSVLQEFESSPNVSQK